MIATKFAAYPWRLTPGQFVKACKYVPLPIQSSLSFCQVKRINPYMKQMSKMLSNSIGSNSNDYFFRSSLDRMQLKQIGIGQLHWSTANYAPLQELALWDGLVAMYEKVTDHYKLPLNYDHFN